MVVMLLGPGFEESEAVVPLDLLRRAGVESVTAALGERTVLGGHGIPVTADLTLDQVRADQVELLVLPGGLGGVEAVSNSPAALDLIRQVHRQGGRIAAICAAPTLLAKLGLLEGRRAVCYPGMEDQMAGARREQGPVAVDGPFVTGQAAGSAFAFGLKLVELLRGEQTAQEVRHAVHYAV